MAEIPDEVVQPVESFRTYLDRFGYLGRDEFGRVYIDTCKTNEHIF